MPSSTEELLARVEQRRSLTSVSLDPSSRTKLGQFFTPRSPASLLASMAPLPARGGWRLIDPGAGVGSLTAALVARWLAETDLPTMSVLAYEIDPQLVSQLEATLAEARALAAAMGRRLDTTVCDENFVLSPPVAGAGNILLMNPPYRKLGVGSEERVSLLDDARPVRVTNLYAAFLVRAVRALAPGDGLVAITPRSFANGPYFQDLRAELLRRATFRHIHVFDDRNRVFSDADVLQENLVFSMQLDTAPADRTVTISRAATDDLGIVTRSHDQVVHPDDLQHFIRLPLDESDLYDIGHMAAMPCTLAELGCDVSTGRVVDFRTRAQLRLEPAADTAPLVYPVNLRAGVVEWPVATHRPQALLRDDATAGLLLPNEHYVVVKRFSAKEETRRVSAAIAAPEAFGGAKTVAYENHLNVFHVANRGLEPRLAAGLNAYLNSRLVDDYVRQFNGHTQINATDLRELRYPTAEQLRTLGKAAAKLGNPVDPDKLDALLARLRQPAASHGRASQRNMDSTRDDLVRQARDALAALGFDKPRSNERSALTLLSLMGLRPGDSWADATRGLHGVSPLMSWMAKHFGKHYAPNTRETVRRQTLHQFVDAALVVLNPDDPLRPINSDKNVYQVDESSFALLRQFGTPLWDEHLSRYLARRPGQQAAYAAARQQAMIPVTLPDGTEIKLTPGGQNVLIREILEQFCPRWTPGGHVRYVGDAGSKEPIYDIGGLARDGVVLDKHGKLPDLVIYLPKRDWLVLIEAASSHGPVDGKRHAELKTLFANSRAGLVYISCFTSRAQMRRYLSVIAWETEAWCADHPTHLIHFNGERFLGPY
jgi:adenine-specific DNA-methyltransferase